MLYAQLTCNKQDQSTQEDKTTLYFTLTHITGNAADAIQVQCGHKSRTACSELLLLSKFKATSAYTAVQ